MPDPGGAGAACGGNKTKHQCPGRDVSHNLCWLLSLWVKHEIWGPNDFITSQPKVQESDPRVELTLSVLSDGTSLEGSLFVFAFVSCDNFRKSSSSINYTPGKFFFSFFFLYLHNWRLRHGGKILHYHFNIEKVIYKL